MKTNNKNLNNKWQKIKNNKMKINLELIILLYKKNKLVRCQKEITQFFTTNLNLKLRQFNQPKTKWPYMELFIV